MNAMSDLISVLLAGYAMWSLPVRNGGPGDLSDHRIRIVECVGEGSPGDSGVGVVAQVYDREKPHVGVGVAELGRNDGETFVPKKGEGVHGTLGWVWASLGHRRELRNRGGGVGANGSQHSLRLVGQKSAAVSQSPHWVAVLQFGRQPVKNVEKRISLRVVSHPLNQQGQVVRTQDEQCFLSLRVVLSSEPLAHGEAVVGGFASGEQSCEQADCEQGSANGDRELRPFAHERSLAGDLGHFNSLCGVLTPSFHHQ